MKMKTECYEMQKLYYLLSPLVPLHFVSIESRDTVINTQLRISFNHVEVRSHGGSQLTRKV